MWAASELETRREKRSKRDVPRFLKHLKSCLVKQQLNQVKLYAVTDDQAETMCIFLPRRRRPWRTRKVVFRHTQWQPVQELLESRGFQVTVWAQHLTIEPAGVVHQSRELNQ